MIIDVHTHMGPGLAQYTDATDSFEPLFQATTASQLVKLLDEVGIDKAIVVPPRWVGGEFIDPDYEQANRAVYDATIEYPDRLIGFARLNPNFGKRAVQEFEKCIREYKFKGLKLDPEWESFSPTSSELVYPLMRLAEQHGLPVLFHSGYDPSEPALFLELAIQFPDVKIILAHMGARLVADTLIVASKASNILVDSSESMYGQKRVIETLGAQRVLFGSNLPFGLPKVEIMKISRLQGISDTDKALILGGNIARMLQLH